MDAPIQKLPACKLVHEKSNFSNKKSRHKAVVDDSYFNFGVNVTLPGCEKLPKEVRSILDKGVTYWIVHQLPLNILMNTDFIEAFVKKGKIYLLSNRTCIDKENCVALLPEGLLVLNLDRDTYEEFGLDGKPSQFNKKRQKKYVVKINLVDQSFKPGRKLHDRVKWCLTDRLDLKMDFLFNWIPPDDKICSSSLSSYFQTLGFQCEQYSSRHHSQVYKKLHIPVINCSDIREDSTENCSYLEFWEWLGALSCDIVCSDESEETYVNSMQIPEPFQTVKKCCTYRLSGLVSPNTIEQLMIFLRDYTEKNECQWSALTVHGFVDCPVSSGTREHGFHFSGENIYSFVIFPNQDYWLYTALGAQDVIP